MKPREVTRMLVAHGRPQSCDLPERAIYYADDVFRALGFSDIDSMDASDYEGASVLHDLNLPVPASMHERYDLVWDGGTLEHVFNVPAAFENAMRMVKIGGHLVLITPANNQCGHGFYQFSPELFFRVFTPTNGFELLRLYATGKGGPFHVMDPATVHGRVELLGCDSTYLMVHARKTHDADVFSAAPQQSDYVTAWDESMEEKRDGAVKAFLRRILSPTQVRRISRILNAWRQRKAVRRWRKFSRLSNRRFYVPVKRWDIPSREATSQAR